MQGNNLSVCVSAQRRGEKERELTVWAKDEFSPERQKLLLDRSAAVPCYGTDWKPQKISHLNWMMGVWGLLKEFQRSRSSCFERAKPPSDRIKRGTSLIKRILQWENGKARKFRLETWMTWITSNKMDSDDLEKKQHLELTNSCKEMW